MMQIFIATLCIFFATEACSTMPVVEEEQPGLMPVRLEELKQEIKGQTKEEGPVRESFGRSGLDLDKPDPDTSTLSPSERTDIDQSPGADMRKLDPKYMEVKVLYAPPETSWWERAIEHVRNFLRPSV